MKMHLTNIKIELWIMKMQTTLPDNHQIKDSELWKCRNHHLTIIRLKTQNYENKDTTTWEALDWQSSDSRLRTLQMQTPPPEKHNTQDSGQWKYRHHDHHLTIIKLRSMKMQIPPLVNNQTQDSELWKCRSNHLTNMQTLNYFHHFHHL